MELTQQSQPKDIDRSAPVPVQVELSPDHQDMLDWGMDAMRRQSWQSAVQRWSRARQHYPEMSEAWIQAAIAHFNIDQFAEAVQLLTEARQTFACVPGAWVETAELYYRQQDTEQAYDYNREAREKFPQTADPWVQYASFAMREENWQEALDRWQQVREKFPQLQDGYLQAAVAARKLGDTTSARNLNREFHCTDKHSADFGEASQRAAVSKYSKLLRFVELIILKSWFNLKSEASTNALSFLWWVIEPVLFMMVFFLVFELLFQRGGGENFVAYLLIGLVPFQWLAKSIQRSSTCIMDGRGLMQQVRISPLFFPLVVFTQYLIKQLPVFSMLFVFLVFYGIEPTLYWLFFIPLFLLQAVLLAITGCLLAMLVPLGRDLTNVVPTAIQFVLFASGVFYPVDIIPERFQTIFFANPMASLLHMYRQIFLYNEAPDGLMFSWIMALSLVMLLCIVPMYKRLAPGYPRTVLE